jgi:hypothetical protein
MPPDDFATGEKERKKRLQDFRDLKKHYVRVRGWLPIVTSYSGRRQRKVKYLTFCAKEAIDVRYFACKGVLYRNQDKNLYPSLTFVESNDEDYAIIVESLGKVALGVKASLEDALLNDGHPDHNDLVGSFPHDIVNLDFCGDIVPSKSAPYNDTLRAIDRVVQLQCEGACAEPWHLFLAFRAQHSQSNAQANEQLRGILDGNLQTPQFKVTYGDRPLPGDLEAQSYAEFLRISVAKFLAAAAERHGYGSRIEGSFVYSRQLGGYHFVKLIVGFQPLRRREEIPGSAGERAAYGVAVNEIFGSTAIDVDSVREDEWAAIEAELALVLAELEGSGVVTG